MIGSNIGILLALLFPLTAPIVAQEMETPIQVKIRTELGDVLVELYPDRAPNTVANFLQYVDGEFFDGGTFHRTVHADNQPTDSIRIAVIQGDISSDRSGDRFGAIALERTNQTGLKHLNGSVSMARSGPDTARSSFFICLGDQPELDYGGRRNPDGQGFAAFGLVLEGMEVVRAVHRSTADGQSLTPPIRILGIERL